MLTGKSWKGMGWAEPDWHLLLIVRTGDETFWTGPTHMCKTWLGADLVGNFGDSLAGRYFHW